VIAIPINNDSIDEFDETVKLALSNVFGNALLVGNKSNSTLTINDNDAAPAVSIGDVMKASRGQADAARVRELVIAACS
jgi:Asp-tRNA(Asn)/Glu-tRNA(Gln) amidotransferase B subunit